MTDNTAHKLGMLIILGMIVQLGVIAYVAYSNYEGRVATVKAQRGGCERSKLDRKAVGVIGTNTLENFRETDRMRGSTTDRRVKAQGEIEGALAGLKVRAEVVCSKAFPKAKVIP